MGIDCVSAMSHLSHCLFSLGNHPPCTIIHNQHDFTSAPMSKSQPNGLTVQLNEPLLLLPAKPHYHVIR